MKNALQRGCDPCVLAQTWEGKNESTSRETASVCTRARVERQHRTPWGPRRGAIVSWRTSFPNTARRRDGIAGHDGPAGAAGQSTGVTTPA